MPAGPSWPAARTWPTPCAPCNASKPQDLPAGEMAAFGISGKIGSLFSSHPPLEQRIAALEQGRD